MPHAETRPFPTAPRKAPEAANDPRPRPHAPSTAPVQVLRFPRPPPGWAVSHFVSLDGAALPVFVRVR